MYDLQWRGTVAVSRAGMSPQLTVTIVFVRLLPDSVRVGQRVKVGKQAVPRRHVLGNSRKQGVNGPYHADMSWKGEEKGRENDIRLEQMHHRSTAITLDKHERSQSMEGM